MTLCADRATDWLGKLVAFDTRNGVGDELPCAQFLKRALAVYKPDSLELGTVPRSRGRSDGAYVIARWGQPKVLLNVHFDTVSSGEGWRSDPHNMLREGGRLIGLGTSDIKGAAACILAELETVIPSDVAVLFSGDEEAGSEVMREIIARGLLDGIQAAIICEPTNCEVGRRHRGFLSYAVHFVGSGGHSSLADSLEKPVLEAARLASEIGQYGQDNLKAGPDSYKGLCVNIGMIDSDGAHNVIPTQAELRFSMRPPPGDDMGVRVADIEAIIAKTSPNARVQRMQDSPALVTKDLGAFASYFKGQEQRPIDLPYWTEAALMSAEGINALVYGPGDVAQAHRPNEYVTLDQLATASLVYRRALKRGSV